MDIYSYLKKDHRHVEELFAKILAARSPARRKVIFNELKGELLLHAETEARTFYTALQSSDESRDTEKEITHAREDHDEVKEYLMKLERMSVESEKWMEQLGELKHAVEHHVKEEEGEIFEEARKMLSREEAIELARQMDHLKQRIMQRAA